MKQFSILLLVGIAASAAQGSVIPAKYAANATSAGFTYLGQSKTDIGTLDYFRSGSPANHAIAQYECRQHFGGRLAVALTDGQHVDLRNFIATMDTCYHIGGTREGSTWMWTSTTTFLPVTVRGWRAGQPDIHNTCMCVHGTGTAYGWHTCPCHVNYFYICQV